MRFDEDNGENARVLSLLLPPSLKDGAVQRISEAGSKILTASSTACRRFSNHFLTLLALTPTRPDASPLFAHIIYVNENMLPLPRSASGTIVSRLALCNMQHGKFWENDGWAFPEGFLRQLNDRGPGTTCTEASLVK